mmetsp:Transcript_30513/g.82628  ORF Transcript_30513/g.82628 Transcript_30513/m.82628 type:complete len:97 (+) Transcript_30513:482-772(+)
MRAGAWEGMLRIDDRTIPVKFTPRDWMSCQRRTSGAAGPAETRTASPPRPTTARSKTIKFMALERCPKARYWEQGGHWKRSVQAGHGLTVEIKDGT